MNNHLDSGGIVIKAPRNKHPKNITTLEWEPVENAESYRMIIRDVNLDEITNKDILTNTRYDFIWNDRNKNHDYIFRTQYRISVNVEWIDMEPYRPIIQPSELALGEVFGKSIHSEPKGSIAVLDSGIRKYSITMLKHLHENVFNE